MTDRTKTLEQEARELYKVIVSAMKPETPRYTEIGERIAEFHFVQGYLAAATARNKEIEELRARVAKLEGMVPKWVDGDERARLIPRGWSTGPEMIWHRAPGMVEAEWLWLMVPPTPLPEGE